jgi:hypothetical protein
LSGQPDTNAAANEDPDALRSRFLDLLDQRERPDEAARLIAR